MAKYQPQAAEWWNKQQLGKTMRTADNPRKMRAVL
jgi:hypothetical protein